MSIKHPEKYRNMRWLTFNSGNEIVLGKPTQTNMDPCHILKSLLSTQERFKSMDSNSIDRPCMCRKYVSLNLFKTTGPRRDPFWHNALQMIQKRKKMHWLKSTWIEARCHFFLVHKHTNNILSEHLETYFALKCAYVAAVTWMMSSKWKVQKFKQDTNFMLVYFVLQTFTLPSHKCSAECQSNIQKIPQHEVTHNQ